MRRECRHVDSHGLNASQAQPTTPHQRSPSRWVSRYEVQCAVQTKQMVDKSPYWVADSTLS
jgi:hypothetical protein